MEMRMILHQLNTLARGAEFLKQLAEENVIIFPPKANGRSDYIVLTQSTDHEWDVDIEEVKSSEHTSVISL